VLKKPGTLVWFTSRIWSRSPGPAAWQRQIRKNPCGSTFSGEDGVIRSWNVFQSGLLNGGGGADGDEDDGDDNDDERYGMTLPNSNKMHDRSEAGGMAGGGRDRPRGPARPRRTVARPPPHPMDH
jgi:hypothetical protein